MACDVSWKLKLSKLNDENMLLKTQVEYVVQERENIKLEFQKLSNSIKAIQTQNKKEVDELIEHVNQKTYAYADVRDQNQDLLMTIFEHKNKLRTIEKGKYVNTKFEKSKTLGKLVCVTPFSKNLGNKVKNVSNTKGEQFPTHIQQILDVCSALTSRVENLEHDNAAQKLEIIKLQARVKRLERANQVKSSKLRRLRKVEASKQIESSDDMK
nr:hypothetical protein [Tanacetum cinerariifolium]